jgi:hypothetical protein
MTESGTSRESAGPGQSQRGRNLARADCEIRGLSRETAERRGSSVRPIARGGWWSGMAWAYVIDALMWSWQRSKGGENDMDDAAGGSGERVTSETGNVVAQSAVAFRVSLCRSERLTQASAALLLTTSVTSRPRFLLYVPSTLACYGLSVII